MKTLIKAAAIIYALVAAVLFFTLPLGGILCIIKACGVGISWLGACIPFIIALSVLPFGAVAKCIIDNMSKEQKNESRNDHAKR